jgi:Aspartyl protease/gag-polyprotein putative aspartyl protease
MPPLRTLEHIIKVILHRAVRVAAGFLLFLPGVIAAQSQSRPTRRLVTIPIEINYSVGTFLIDTGSNRSILDSAFAQRLGLKLSGTAKLTRAHSTEDCITTTAEHFSVGPKSWSGAPFVVLDLRFLSRISAAPISGVLGTDFLATMLVKLSYSSGSAQVITDIGIDIDPGVSVVPLKEVEDRYFVPIRIGPSTFEMLLDSGTNMTAVSESAWRKLPSAWKPHEVLEGIQSSGSPAGSLIGCVHTLQLGDVVLHHHPVRVIMPSQSESSGETALSGILGGDILERFDVTLDLRHATMYLKPDPAFRPDPYEFATVGIQFFKVDASAFSVAAVWKRSPAEQPGSLLAIGSFRPMGIPRLI